MATRMEKYYGHSAKSTKANSRSKRNLDLYNEIFTYGNYSNIEGVANIGKSNEVDLAKVRELLENQENNKRRVSSRKDVSSFEKVDMIRPKRYEDLEEKNYDIRDILKEAKENKEPDDKERVLRNTQYNILKNIDLSKEIKKEDYFKDDDDELKELIQTITNTSMLNKVGDVDLASDLLSDLKADDTKVGEIKNIKELIDKEGPARDKDLVTDYDKSFFTSSLKLNKSDFVTGDEEPKKTGVFTIALITVLIVIMIVSGAILVMRLL